PDHLRHQKIIIFSQRRVLDDVLGNAAIRHDIRSLLHRHRRHRRHWLDAIDVDLAQLLDERQNGVELVPEMLDLILGHGNAGEMRDAADNICVDGHESSASGFRPAYSRAAFTATTGSLNFYDAIRPSDACASATRVLISSPAGISRPRAAAWPASMGEKSPD